MKSADAPSTPLKATQPSAHGRRHALLRSILSLTRWIYGPFVEWWELVRRSWHSAFVTVASQSLAIATVALASRGLGAEAYGHIVAIAAYYGWFSLISVYTTHALIPRLMADPDLDLAAKRGACAMSFWLTACLTLVAAVLALAALPVGARWFNIGPFQDVAGLYAIVFAISYLNTVILNLHQAAGWLRQWSLIGLLAGGLPVLLILGYRLIQNTLNPRAYMLLLIAAGLTTTCTALILLARNLGGWRNLKPDLRVAGPLLRAGRGPWVANFSAVLATFGLSSLIAGRLTKTELAHYDVVLQLHFWATTVGLCVSVPAMADFSRLASARDYAGLVAIVRRRQISTGVVLGTAAVVAFIFARPLLVALYGPEYADGAPLLRILVFSWVSNGLGGWYWFCMFAIGQTWRVAPANIMFGVPTFIISLILLTVTPLGAAGAVIARVIGITLWFVTYEVSFRRALVQARRG